jgi:hypothetical protein
LRVSGTPVTFALRLKRLNPTRDFAASDSDDQGEPEDRDYVDGSLRANERERETRREGGRTGERERGTD